MTNNGQLQATSKALAHPLRVRILELMGLPPVTPEQAKGPDGAPDEIGKDGERLLSPNLLAVELGEPLGNVSYHVKRLCEYGAVKLVKTRPRRGAVEHFYRRTGAVSPTGDANLALDRIREAVATADQDGNYEGAMGTIVEVLEDTGRSIG